MSVTNWIANSLARGVHPVRSLVRGMKEMMAGAAVRHGDDWSRAPFVIILILAACGGPAGSNGAAVSGDGSTPGDGSGSNGSGAGNLGACSDCPGTTGYSASVCANDDNVELHLCKSRHHFASIITTTAGAVVFRPHPGNDPNGWGSSLYLQAFLADASVLSGASAGLEDVSDTGITVIGSGPVNGPGTNSSGRWSWTLTFSYDESSKDVHMTTGSYDVALTRGLVGTGSDLNLFRLSSNYLHDVPLLDPTGTVGDTGDLQEANARSRQAGGIGDVFDYTWIPPEAPDFYPRTTASTISIDAVGQYNVIDTAAQSSGYQIAAAYKPSLTVTLASHTAPVPMIFGASYDMSRASDIAADNVGISAIVLQSWTGSAADFELTLDSVALPDDPGQSE